MISPTSTPSTASVTQYPDCGDTPITLGAGTHTLTARIVRWHGSNELALYLDTGAAEIVVTAKAGQLVDLAAACYAACGDQLIADQLARARA